MMVDLVLLHNHQCNSTLQILDTKGLKLRVDPIDQDRALAQDRALVPGKDLALALDNREHLLADALEAVP
jgi:hypothetical protein